MSMTLSDVVKLSYLLHCADGCSLKLSESQLKNTAVSKRHTVKLEPVGAKMLVFNPNLTAVFRNSVEMCPSTQSNVFLSFQEATFPPQRAQLVAETTTYTENTFIFLFVMI